MTQDVRRLVRQLVDAVVGPREDGRIVRRVLTVMVETAIADFGRYYDVRHARNRVVDFDILMARERAKKQRQSAEAVS